MRDGINCAANIYFPEGAGPWPVILNRTPYIKDSAVRSKRSEPYVQAGYVYVSVDVRGRGDSEGDYNPNFQEIEDGYDAIEWCGTQSWSTGKVGTQGGSYEGWTQVYPMRLRNSHHAAAFLQCTPSMHPFDEGFYWSGVPQPIMGMMALYTSGHTLKEQIANLDWANAVDVRPLKDLHKVIGLPSVLRDEQFNHQVFDDHYKKLWFDGVYDLVNVPCYHVTGWFDDDQKGTLELFPALALNHPDPAIRKSQKLLIGPWPHRLSSDSSKLGDFDYGPHSMVPLAKEAIRWFDYWLKGIDNGIVAEPRCRLFLMGENRWIESNSFPIEQASEKIYHLAADGPANSLLGQGKLLDAQAGAPAPADNTWSWRSTSSDEVVHSTPSDTYTYNPAKPAPNPFWKENFQNGTNEDLRSIQRRDDVLVFTTDPLTEPLNIVGKLKAKLYVSTTALDTDFIARLSDVHPDGYAMRLNAGIMRLRYRDGYEQMKLVKPNDVVKIEIDMWATGHQFQKGHAVRLEITSSAYPTWAPNYNTGGNVWEETEPIVAQQTVYHSAQYPSKLILPEVKNPKLVDAWPESRWTSEK
jgi:hypothetical protein